MGNKQNKSEKIGNQQTKMEKSTAIEDVKNVNVFLFGQKNSGKTTFLKLLSHKLEKKKNETNSNDLLEAIELNTRKFVEFCEKNSISLTGSTNFENYLDFYSNTENLKFLDRYYKEIDIPDGIYKLLRYKDISNFYPTDDLYLYDNKLTIFKLKLDKYDVNFIKSTLENTITPNDHDFALYFINASNYLEPDFFEKVNQDLKKIPINCYIILTKVDLFLDKCYDHPISKEYFYLHDQIKHIKNSLNYHIELLPVNLLGFNSSNILKYLFNSFLQKTQFIKDHHRKSKKVLVPEVYQISPDIWKEEILSFYDFSDEIPSLLLVSKGMYQIVQEYLIKGWITVSQFDNLRFFQQQHQYYKSHGRNIHFPNFNYHYLSEIMTYKNLVNLKLFNNFILTKEELFPKEKKKIRISNKYSVDKKWDYTDDNQNRIILLGCGESGKATIFKHIMMLLDNFPDKTSNTFKCNLIENIWRITSKIGNCFMKRYPDSILIKYLEKILDFDNDFSEFKDGFGYSIEKYENILRLWCEKDFIEFAKTVLYDQVAYHDGCY